MTSPATRFASGRPTCSAYVIEPIATLATLDLAILASMRHHAQLNVDQLPDVESPDGTNRELGQSMARASELKRDSLRPTELRARHPVPAADGPEVARALDQGARPHRARLPNVAWSCGPATRLARRRPGPAHWFGAFPNCVTSMVRKRCICATLCLDKEQIA